MGAVAVARTVGMLGQDGGCRHVHVHPVHAPLQREVRVVHGAADVCQGGGPGTGRGERCPAASARFMVYPFVVVFPQKSKNNDETCGI